MGRTNVNIMVPFCRPLEEALLVHSALARQGLTRHRPSSTRAASGRRIGLCGQALSDFPEFARFLVECGIDSMSLNSDAVLPTTRLVIETETVASSP